MEKIKKFLIYFLFICLGITLIFEKAIISIIIIGIIMIVSYKLNIPKFGLVLFLSAFILRLIVIFLINTPIISDYKVMYDTAEEITSGNIYAAASSVYMLRWGYQMGYTLIMALLMLIFKGPLLIKIVNCLFSSLIVLFIYLIAKELTNQKIARTISVLYMFFPFPLLFNTVLSNQHISSFMFLLAIYILISKKFKDMNGILKFSLIGLCLAIGNIIRPEAIIFNVSILLFLIVTSEKGKYKIIIRNFSVLILTYICLTTLSSAIVTNLGISPNGFKNSEPLWKIAVGFNTEKKGDYNKELASVFWDMQEEEKLNVIYNYTIGSLGKLPILFLYKAQHFWLDSDVGWSLSFLNDKSTTILGYKITFNNIINFITFFNSIYIYLIFICAVLAIWVNRKKMEDRQILLLIILLVYFGVYLLIECTPRYAYTAQIFMFLMSAYFMDFLEKKLQLLKSKKIK